MDKNAVTRTFSIGAISSGNKTSNDFFAARRHSSAGIRALLWATSSAKSLRGSQGLDSQASWENLFPNILTPDSIPQFTIPRLSVQNSLRSLDKEAEDDSTESGEGLGSLGTEPVSSLCASLNCSTLSLSTSSSSGLSLALSDRKAERSVSDPSPQRRSHLHREMPHHTSFTEDQHCLDPASKAALSLPHLTKVTTPYGFITLSQSPQMVSEEALLCQAGLWRVNKDSETRGCPSEAPAMKTVDSKACSPSTSEDKKKSPKDSTDLQNKESVKEEMEASSASISSTSVPRNTDRKCRRHFYKIIRKHFTSFGMKSCD